MAVKHYRELIVWQKAMDLVELVYRATRYFPKEEMFGLTMQIRKAAVSIPSNIAEGQGRNTTREFMHFLSVARGSLQEMETQILLGERMTYLTAEQSGQVIGLSSEVGRLMTGLLNSLSEKCSQALNQNPLATSH
jgi:four helix bundle protein